MTLVTQKPRVVIVGNGSLGPYSLVDENSVAIRFVSTSHVKLTRYSASTDDNNDGTVLVLNTDYTVGGTQDARTFTLIGSQAVLTSSQRIVAERNQTYVQDLDLTTGGAFNAESVETRFDKVAEYLQEVKTRLDRMVPLQFADTTSSVGFPSPPTSATKFLARNTTGEFVYATAAELSADVALGANWETILGLPAAGILDNLAGIRFVATYAALTALTTATGLSDNSTYCTYGRDAEEDGGFGVWRYDSGSSATANGGTILAIDGGGAGRFFRLFVSPASSAWFITPHASTVQTTALQAFLNCHHDLWLEEGTIVSATVTVPADTRLRGTRASILKHNSPSGTFISCGGDNIELSGFSVNGNQTTDTFAGGYTANHHGIACVGTAGTPKVNLVIEGMSIKNCGDSGIYTDFVTNKRIRKNDIERCGYAGSQGLSSVDAWVEENDVYNIFPGSSGNCYGLTETRSGSNRIPNNVHIDYNRVDEVLPWEAIDIHDGKHCSISNNIISNSAQGIAYEAHVSGAAGDDVRIDNNIILGWSGLTTTKDGQTYRKTGGIVCVGAVDNEQGKTLSICGNNISLMGDTRATASSGAIFATKWDGWDVSDNHLRDSYRAAIVLTEGGTGGMTNGICNDNNIVNVTLHDSVCRGIEAQALVSGTASGNRVTGLSSGTETFYQSSSATQKLTFIRPRETLYAARTYYVRTDGTDTNIGTVNSAAGAFLTIQAAANAATDLDLNGFNVTIQVGAGTYTGAITLRPVVGNGTITILGDATTPANVVISTTSASCISATSIPIGWTINGLKLQTTTSGHCISLARGSVLAFLNIDFGASAQSHIYAQHGSLAIATGNYNVTGGAAYHWNAEENGLIDVQARTLTITNTPAFSSQFAIAFTGGSIRCNGCTFSGSATGVRYNASMNGKIYADDAGTTALPGDSAGSTATGGVYD
jgi:hypothetical protein